MGGILAGLMAGAGKAGFQAVDTLQQDDLQAKRDARLNEWKVEAEQRLAERQEAQDSRRAEREEARWTKDREIAAAREDAAERRHGESQRTAQAAIDQRERASQRQFDAMMARIGAMNGGAEGAGGKRFKLAIDTANAMREAGNTEGANKILEQVWTGLSGKDIGAAPPPPKPGGTGTGKPAASAQPAAARVAPQATPESSAYAGRMGAPRALWEQEASEAGSQPLYGKVFK